MRSKPGKSWKPEIWKKLNKEILYQLYVGEQKTLNEIAEIYGCSQNIIRTAMNKYGIKRRSVSEAMKIARVKKAKSYRTKL